MNYTKTSPVGIDSVIQQIQTYLYENLGWPNLDGYGRAYVERSSDSVVPMVYISNGEYKAVTYIDDRNHFFFHLDNNRSNNNRFTTMVHVIFVLNLIECYPDITHRGDEEAHKTVSNLLNNYTNYRLNGSLITGQQDVFVDFNLPDDAIYDKHPRHCFRVSFELFYNYDSCN